jgi:hypothetical protein
VEIYLYSPHMPSWHGKEKFYLLIIIISMMGGGGGGINMGSQDCVGPRASMGIFEKISIPTPAGNQTTTHQSCFVS